MLTRLSISSDVSRAAHGCSRPHACASQYIWPCKPPCRPNLMAAPLCALLRLRRLGIRLRFLGLCLCALCLCPGLCCLRLLCITSLPLSVLLLLFLLANRLAHTTLHSSDTCDHTRSCQHACIRTPCVHTCINISSTKKRFWGKRCSALRAAADADNVTAVDLRGVQSTAHFVKASSVARAGQGILKPRRHLRPDPEVEHQTMYAQPWRLTTQESR